MKAFISFLFLSLSFNNVLGGIGSCMREAGTALATKTLSCPTSRPLNLDVSEIVVYFYDFQHKVQKSFPIDEAAQSILALKNLDKSYTFFMFVGGFRSKINKQSSEDVRTAFRNLDNHYLIMIDHSAYTNGHDGCKTSYERSFMYVPSIGKKLAKMLASLHDGGIPAKNIRCAGHSLGGQMLGYVGEYFTKKTGEKISRITALDPAGPCFVSHSKRNSHIRSGVAEYVEIYHCNAGMLGSSKPMGDVNFFANDGKSQPHCGTNPMKSSKCSHTTCVPIWTATITNHKGYDAYECQKYKNFVRNLCSKSKKTIAGFWNPGTEKGIFYFSTHGFHFN